MNIPVLSVFIFIFLRKKAGKIEEVSEKFGILLDLKTFEPEKINIVLFILHLLKRHMQG